MSYNKFGASQRRSRRLLLSAAGIAVIAGSGSAHAVALETVAEDEIIVTASPLEKTVDETIVGTSILSKEQLAQRLQNSIGETLRNEPGISTTYFGQGASRPIIRGLGGDRIRVLDNGIGSIDASVTSPDHAVAIDPATAEQVEIVRGAAMLLYGSSAAGGVVNVISNRIPTAAPEDGLDVTGRVGLSTADDAFEGAAGIDLTLGEFGDGAIVLHVDGFHRDADDYNIPGFAESAAFRAAEEAEEEEGEEHDEEEEVFGVLENSAYETTGGSAGLSWVFADGFIGVSGTMMDTNYGVPGGHGHEEGEEEEEEGEEEGGVTIDLKQRRFDLAGELNRDFAWFSKAKIRFGYADYEHTEFEPNGEAGTVFSNEGWEARAELVNKTKTLWGGELNGASGIQYRSRDFSAIGEEAFVPPSMSNQFGIFSLTEFTKDALRFELGGRYENTNHETADATIERSFDAFSISGGVGWTATENLFFGLQAMRTERAPSTEELFSNGPHLATEAFEIGNPDLDKEVGKGVEVTARYVTDRLRFAVNGFYTSYDDFIFERANGEVEDGLDVFEFTAADANFRGFEAQLDAELFQLSVFDIHGDMAFDYVRATANDGAENLPRIPPVSGLIGVEARSGAMDLRAEFEFASDQDQVADFELPTDGYEMINLYATYRPFGADGPIALRLSANNVTDEEVRFHTSFLKDVTPFVGRNIRFSVTGTF